MNADQDDYEVENHVSWLLDDFNDAGGYDLLSDAQRAACLIWTMRWSVSNGGYASWVEAYGPRTPDLIAALALVGASPYVSIVGDVALAAPSLAALDEESRLVNASAAHLSELDQRFFDLNREQDLLDTYLRPLLRTHRQDFPTTIDDL